jgi:hypothetical protein
MSDGRGSKREDDYVGGSELARLGYCERRVFFDAQHGRRASPAQRDAQRRGDRLHAQFYAESKRLIRAGVRKGPCFIATLVLGNSEATGSLRAFRDMFLRRHPSGHWLIGWYYQAAPTVCRVLAARPGLIRLLRPVLFQIARCAQFAIDRKARARCSKTPE